LTRRVLPWVTILFVLCFLDRVNLSYAALDMNRELGFAPSVYGFGAGIFFLGYFLFEVPGAMLVERRSARIWLGAMLIAWGTCAALMGTVHSMPQFYALRFLLGVAEAGFFPGIIIYLSHWFPRADRARAIGALAVGLPAANLVGAHVSSWLLRHDWLAIAGWRWLFVVEGVPSIFFGIGTMLWLKDHPRDAKWLSSPEREWLEATLRNEGAQGTARPEAAQPLLNRGLVVLSAIWFLDNMGVYGFNLWLPLIIKRLSGFSSATVAAVSSLPFLGALAAAAFVSLSSDRSGERRWHTALPMLVFGTGLGASVLCGGSLWLSMAALCVAALGLTSGTPGFWALATAAPGAAGSARVAIITSMGALGGFCGPYLMGYLRAATNGFESGLFVLSGIVLLAGLLVLTRK